MDSEGIKKGLGRLLGSGRRGKNRIKRNKLESMESIP